MTATSSIRISRSEGARVLRYGLLAAIVLLTSSQALAQGKLGERNKSAKPAVTAPNGQPVPFASNLFMGNFQAQHKDGINPNYRVMPGDRVAVNTWGTVEINKVFVVDGQGNIFLPGVGPIRLAGVRNANLTRTVSGNIAKIYRRNFGVYTNLLTAAPVAVFVTGGVARPGRYAGVPSDSVLFFLDQAGGVAPSMGSYRDIAVLRDNKPLATVDLYDFVLHGKLPVVQFADGDTILVRRRGPVVEVRGEVARSSLIEFKKPVITGVDALEIVPKAARATAVTIVGTRNGQAFHRTLTAAEFRNATLRDGDAIQFRDDGNPGTILVHLTGEFKGSSVLSVKRGSRLLDVLNHVPVDPIITDVASIHLRRPSVAKAQKKSIDDSLFRLERSALLALSRTEREAGIRAKEGELMKSFIATAKQIQPLGRIVTSVRGHQLNVLLRDGDTIVIPPRTNVVRVSGEIQMSQAVVYSPGMTARDYVRMSGGYTARSNTDKVIILHASAAVTMGGANSVVRPGDELLIPPKIDRKLLQNAADVTQVLYQIAVAAAVVVAL